jgi:hypothetical protein
MTNEQLYLAIGLPILFNTAVTVALWLNLRSNMNDRFNGVNDRFNGVSDRFRSVDQHFDAINQRFDDMRDLWRAELHRVEEVLDARLKHLEER